MSSASTAGSSSNAASRAVASGFFLSVTGQVDACQMSGVDNLYVKYSFNKGHDWSVMAGVEHGVSQIAKRSSGGPGDTLVWNYPLDILFRSCNVHGWPQIVLGVYGLTAFGGDVVRGYASVHVPSQPGRHTRYVQLYTPVSSSFCQRLTAWITNNPPEFFDSKFVAQGKGREVTRVRSHGVVKITFNVSTKNMREWGYQNEGERGGPISGVPRGIGAGDGADGGYPSLQQQQQLMQQSSYSAGSGLGGGSGLSRAPSTYGGAASSSSVPPKTQLSAATSAMLAAQQARGSAGNSRENSLARRGTSQRGASEGGHDEFDEAKYEHTSLLSQRPLATGGFDSSSQQLQSGSSQLAPLRQGSRQLNPL